MFRRPFGVCGRGARQVEAFPSTHTWVAGAGSGACGLGRWGLFVGGLAGGACAAGGRVALWLLWWGCVVFALAFLRCCSCSAVSASRLSWSAWPVVSLPCLLCLLLRLAFVLGVLLGVFWVSCFFRVSWSLETPSHFDEPSIWNSSLSVMSHPRFLRTGNLARVQLFATCSDSVAASSACPWP